MASSESDLNKSASDEIFAQVEESLAPGPVRDLWLGVRAELAENGPGAVRTYLQSEFQRRRGIVENSLQELSSQLEDIT